MMRMHLQYTSFRARFVALTGRSVPCSLRLTEPESILPSKDASSAHGDDVSAAHDRGGAA